MDNIAHEEQEKNLLTTDQTMQSIDASVIINALYNLYSGNDRAALQINDEYFYKIMGQNLSYQKLTSTRIQCASSLQKPKKLQKLFSNELNIFNLSCIKIKNSMAMAYNRHHLSSSQFKELQECFQLGKDKIKRVNCSDPKSLQILRYAIFNKQQIPDSLVKVVCQMAKAKMKKENQNFFKLLFKATLLDSFIQTFQPPLDLYLDLINTGHIQPTKKQLIEVYTNNEYLFERKQGKKEFCSTVSQKKRLIFNQFPYMLDIFNRINTEDIKGHTYERFKVYMEKILNELQFSSEHQLLERYIPEVKCRYLRVKPHLSSSEIEYLFTTLKKISEMEVDDFEILYQTRSRIKSIIKEYEINPWANFGKIQELCANILSKKGFHLALKQLEQLGERLNFQNYSFDIDLVKNELIFVLFREQSFQGQQFSKPLVKNIYWIFKNIPDKKKRKQCCYILLLQYILVVYQNPSKRAETIKQFTFPEEQLDTILDEGRQLSLDLLLKQDDKSMIFGKNNFQKYSKIIKKVITETQNKQIRLKAIKLQKKINIINNSQCQHLCFYEQNLIKNNQLIELLEAATENGKLMSIQSIENVGKILHENYDPEIKRICLCTVKNVIKNWEKGQILPQRFEKNLIIQFDKLYFQQKFSQQAKIQMLNIAIQLTKLNNIQTFIDMLIKFLTKVLLYCPVDSWFSINSSFAIYLLALNLKQFNHNVQCSIVESIEIFLNKIIKKYNNILEQNSRTNMNILCAITAFAKNYIPLPLGLISFLTQQQLKNNNFSELPLLAIYYHMKNCKSLVISEKVLLNICQILKRSAQNETICIKILQIYLERERELPDKVISKIEQLSKMIKNASLCNLYKKIMQQMAREQNFMLRRSRSVDYLKFND